MAKSAKKKIASGKKISPRLGKPERKLFGRTSRKRADKTKKAPDANSATASGESNGVVLDRLFAVIESRRTSDPSVSHSARLLSRGAAKVAQKFGEEAVECLIEAVAGNRDALIAESADVLYHLLVLWVSSGVNATDVWEELMRREGISGIAEKAARAKPVVARDRLGTSKIP